MMSQAKSKEMIQQPLIPDRGPTVRNGRALEVDFTKFSIGAVVTDGFDIIACPMCGKSGEYRPGDAGLGRVIHFGRIVAFAGSTKFDTVDWCRLDYANDQALRRRHRIRP